MSLLMRYFASSPSLVTANRIMRRYPSLKKSLGFTWVFLFFFWSVPKWQYPHVYDLLQRLGR